MDTFATHVEHEFRSKYSHLMVQWYEMINWTEPLIVGLICFHLLLFLMVYLTRKRFYFQCFLFLLIILLLVGMEHLNTYLRAHWQMLATQQYFDTRGVFMGIFYGAPLLLAGFFQLVCSCICSLSHKTHAVVDTEYEANG